jgi:hypothetical protein
MRKTHSGVEKIVIALTVYRHRARVACAAGARTAPARVVRMQAGMCVSQSTAFTIPLALDGDGEHAARCRLELCDTGGWNVRLEIDDRVVTTTHCADWHRAERMCAAITSEWRESHTAPSARR